MPTRRTVVQLVAGAVLSGITGQAFAADKTVDIGVNLSLTGPDAEGAGHLKDGIAMAIDAANQADAVPGYHIRMVVFDDGTATAGQYDPAQAATNARRMVKDPDMVAALGPQMSGSAKAMAPILSEGDLAIITPSATNPDLTSPKFAAEFRPNGKPIFFRTVTTDAYQGPYMANFMVDRLGVKSIYILDDSGAYGIGMADAFEQQAKAKGVKLLGRDRLDPKAADYTAVLSKIRSLNPDAIYYGGVTGAGSKLAKQAYDVVPNMIKAGGDGVAGSPFLSAVGFPAAEGWYSTLASPHVVGDRKAAQFVEVYTSKHGTGPNDYTITAYDAALVVIDAIKRVAATGKPITRDAVRDAIQNAKVPTIQGLVSFDANGDLQDRTISVFQVRHDPKYPVDDILHQYTYVGAAPES